MGLYRSSAEKADEKTSFMSLALSGRGACFALAIVEEILFVRNGQKDWNAKRDPSSGVTPKSILKALKLVKINYIDYYLGAFPRFPLYLSLVKTEERMSLQSGALASWQTNAYKKKEVLKMALVF